MQKHIVPRLLLAFLIFFLLAVFLDSATSFLYSKHVVIEQSMVMAKQGVATTTIITNASVQKTLYPVLRVVDGDTIDIAVNGVKTRLRLIGINTPETVDPRRKVECFGKEASARAKLLLTGSNVSIELDPTQDKYDKYGRLLAYVYLPDGTSFNKKMIEEGYAYEYTYKLPYKYQREFKQAQYEASHEGRGLWAAGVCAKG